ncbi:hypothetical protein M9H61_02520 [Thalassospira sp. GO-4]|uniref:hypothetical protein n=1 Tax=Thalassospira TaxID=168934 RepID=UPI002024130F|nr:hypothetical protein [Thalassospira sp. GO-4]URK18401.1 hypothetical protein M9H61_02520 [Thalassospira sp. GO-4]
MQSSEEKLEFLRRLIVSQADLQIASSALAFLEVEESRKYSKPELRKLKCFETTFIVAYARPFSANKGGRYRSLSPKRLGFNWSDEERHMHDYIIGLRNKIYAHSDEDFAHVRLDGFDVLEESDLLFPHLQFDEGLKFAKFQDQILAEKTTAKAMGAVAHQIFSLTQELRDFLPVYVQPKNQT